MAEFLHCSPETVTTLSIGYIPVYNINRMFKNMFIYQYEDSPILICENFLAVILEPRKIKSATVSTVSPSICHEVMGLDAIILVF